MPGLRRGESGMGLLPDSARSRVFVCDGAENLKLGSVLGTCLIAVVMYLRKPA